MPFALKNIRGTNLVTGFNTGRPVTELIVFNEHKTGGATPEANLENPKFKLEMSNDDILRIFSDLQSNLKYWHIAGGEPLNQTEEICGLLEAFKERYSFIPTLEIETTGLKSPHKLVEKFKVFGAELTKAPDLLFAIKIPVFSAPGKPVQAFSSRVNVETLKAFQAIPHYFLFEVAKAQDVQEVQRILQIIKEPKETVFLTLPVVHDREFIHLKPWIQELCAIEQFNLTIA